MSKLQRYPIETLIWSKIWKCLFLWVFSLLLINDKKCASHIRSSRKQKHRSNSNFIRQSFEGNRCKSSIAISTWRDVPLTTLISHLIQDFYYRQITWFILGIITFMIWRSSLESHPLWVTLQVEMGIVYVNKRNFWKRTKFFVSDGVVQKTSNDLDRSEKRKKAFFKNEREKT